jgi:catechol 2,3-dioxygenase-like lactoylglutathione lyase family enzyme
MLRHADATPMIAVSDIDRAKQFYSSKLGLEPSDGMGDEFFMLRSGNTTVNVYRSEFAGTNKATALIFDVDDIVSEVRELKEKGVAFEHYDVDGLTPEGDIYRGEGMKTAWFKDPDGNILSLVEEA